jgi:hypothetical protein
MLKYGVTMTHFMGCLPALYGATYPPGKEVMKEPKEAYPQHHQY